MFVQIYVSNVQTTEEQYNLFPLAFCASSLQYFMGQVEHLIQLQE